MRRELYGLYAGCRLCPRECGADRVSGVPGRCGMSARLRLARAALHFWEEPCISGSEGSGTVFFSGCPLKCSYCQNHEISRGFGKDVGDGRLADIFLELESAGANNINLVTPTHYVPHVISGVGDARSRGLGIPVVYNTSGYEKEETIGLLEGTVDVYLTDFKYMNADTADGLSDAGDYPAAAKRALRAMVLQTGDPEYDERGIMTRGVIVRHLVLPGRLNEAKDIIGYLHGEYGDSIVMSIMNQYTPVTAAGTDGPMARSVSAEEYDSVVDFAESKGVMNAYIQEGETADESFIPPFDLTGV